MDTFIKVSFEEDRDGDPLIGHWTDQGNVLLEPSERSPVLPIVGSARHSSPLVLL